MADSEKRFQRQYKYYGILEISRNATQEELRKAFRRLVRKYHPDRNLASREAETKFKKIKEVRYGFEGGEGQDRGCALHATT